MSRHIFETSMEKIGRILAAQYNIEVIFEGSVAYTDGKRVVLPHFDEMTEEMRADMNAYLDHEVAHCKFTDFPQVTKVISRFHKELLNACEDSRIEIEMINEYPGTAFNLHPLNAKLRAMIGERWSDLPWPIRTIIGVRDIMDGKEPLIDVDTKRYIEASRAKAIELRDCKNTESVRKVTEEIARLITEERELEKEEERKIKGDEGDDAKGEGEDAKGKGKGAKGKGAKDEIDDDIGEERDKKRKGSSKGSDADSTGPEGKKAASKGGDDAKGSGGGSDCTADEMLSESVHAKDSEFDKHIHDVHGMMDDEIRRAVEYDSKPDVGTPTKGPRALGYKMDYTPHVPLTTRFDQVTDHTGKGHADDYAHLKRAVMPHVSPIKRALERVLKVQENAKWSTGRERGSIDARSLSKLRSSPGYREIFKDYTRTETNNVAVEILCDMSGSMAHRMTVAKQAIIAMSEALKDLNIPFEVTGFNSTFDPRCAQLAEKMGVKSHRKGGAGRYNRINERLDLHVFKSFDSVSLTGITELHALAENPDGECVAWAAKRLSFRKEKRKILIVFSDGQPSSGDSIPGRLAGDLQRKVESIQKAGIEVVGIGIQTDAVKAFYPDYVVITEMSDLPKVCMAKLAKIIAKGA